MNATDVVVNALQLYGGELAGRTRLQKTVYLLDHCGAKLGLTFSYHHFGPYSFELTDGWVDAEAEGQITVEERDGRYGVTYSVFKLVGAGEQHETPGALGAMSWPDARRIATRLESVSNVVLELAATMVYLARANCVTDVVEELKVLKPVKATEALVGEATSLLDDLGVSVSGVA